MKPLLTNMQSDVIQAAVNDLSKLYLEDVYEANSCGNTGKVLVIIKLTKFRFRCGSVAVPVN